MLERDRFGEDRMENHTGQLEMLDYLISPAFAAEDGILIHVNAAAKAALLSEGDPVEPLLATGKEEYSAMTEGSLFLSVYLMGEARCASVHCRDGCRIFIAEEADADAGLRQLSLAAMKLREPLNDIMAVTDQMFPELMESEDPERLRQMAQVNRGLYRILRTVGNMADAEQYFSRNQRPQFEPTELGAFYYEIFQKAEPLGEAAQVEVTYTCPNSPINAMVDRSKLERAAYNLLSNALKFTPKGGRVRMELERRGGLATLKITDNGEGIPRDMLDTVFARFRREPSFGDNRWGIGLGLPIVTRAAAIHGGALLLRQAEHGGAVVAMSIRLNEDHRSTVSAPVLRVDYTGEHDHGLVELADCLPWEVFETGSIN